MTALLLALLALAQAVPHPCDVVQPVVITVGAGTLTVQVCWTGLDTATPPAVVVAPVWTLVVDGLHLPITLTKTGAASASGQYLYTGTTMLPVGTHQVALQVARTTGESALAVPTLTVTVAAVPNLAPVVDAGPNLNVAGGGSAALVGRVTDDGLPLRVSPSGLRVPVATSLLDTQLARWTLDPGPVGFQPIMKDGVQQGGGLGSRLLWQAGFIYALGDDATPTWYQWDSGGWVQIGADPGVAAVPVVPAPVTQQWTQTSGPGVATFTTPTAAATSATFSAPGTYILRLTATDGTLTAFDELTVVVAPPPVVLAVVAAVTSCRLTVSGAPPDSTPGWSFQALYGKTAPTGPLGPLDATEPYAGTLTLLPGAYVVAARWTRPGTAPVTTPPQPATCP